MSMSVTSAEAGLIAAPWQAAEQDATLEQAAKNFYEQSKDLTQHGKKDHPTDRIVLDDVAATLALELAAQDPAHRAHSLSEYVKLPGSGDGFQITLSANGSETLNRTPNGPGGATSLPGGDAVIAQYAAVVGHTPSQDEMAGFLAAAVAGGSLPAGTNPATAQLTVTGQDGTVLATGTAAQLLAQWAGLLAANEEVTPTIILTASSGPGNDPTNGPGEPQQQAQILNGTEGAAFLLGLAIQGGATTGAMVAGYNSTVSYFDQIDQPMLAVAVHYEQGAEAAQKAGNSALATLEETAAKLALQIAAEPEGARGSLSQTLHVGGKETEVTVSQTTTDITGGAQFHDIDQGIGGIIEQVVGIVADVLSFVPVVDAIAIPVAIAVGAAEGGQDLADGNILGGVLALAGSAAGGVGQYASDIGEAIGESTADVTTAAQDVSRGVAAAQGVDGAVTGAEGGDPLAALTSLAGGVAGSAGAGTDWGKGLAAGSALAGAGVAAAGGNWMSALAATQTAAAGAGLFGTYDPDDNAAPAASDSQDPPPGWQSAAVQPVQQEDLPPLDAAAAASAGMATPATIAAASTTASTQATVATAVSQATNTSPVDPDAPDGPNGSSQQQADAQQAAQQQAAQRLGATMAAQANANSQPLPVPPIPPADIPPSPAAQANADAIASGAGMAQPAASAAPSGLVQLAQNPPTGAAGDVPQSLPGGDASPAASANYPIVAPHPAPDGSGAWTNLSDADYDAFQAGIPAPAAPASADPAPPPSSPDPATSAPPPQPTAEGSDAPVVRLGLDGSSGDGVFAASPTPPAFSLEGQNLPPIVVANPTPTSGANPPTAPAPVSAPPDGPAPGPSQNAAPAGSATPQTMSAATGLPGLDNMDASGNPLAPATAPTIAAPDPAGPTPPNGLMMPAAQLASLGAASLALGGTTAAIGTVPTSSLGSLAPALPALPELAPLAVVAPALVLPLTLSGDTMANPNAPVSVPVQGQPNLSAWASPSQVTLYQTSPALFGLLSTVQGTATLQYAPGGSPNSASLVDGQGNVQGALQGGQITLTNPAALTFNPPGSTPAPVAPATPANAGTPSASSLAGVAVRLGNTAAMTGLDAAGAIPATPGFTLAPPMAPLPGYSPPNLNLPPLTGTPIPDQPAMPISTGTPLPNVNLGNWQETFPISQPTIPLILESVQANKAAGDAYEADVILNTLPQTQINIQPQITIKSGGPSGLNVRLDAIGTDVSSGALKLSDMKASQTAPLTSNQKAVYPELQQYGGTIVGQGKAPYVGGMSIPPTAVDIIRKP